MSKTTLARYADAQQVLRVRPRREPDRLLSKLRRCVAAAYNILSGEFTPREAAIRDTLLDLADITTRLDAWFSSGGVKPKLWSKAKLRPLPAVRDDEVDVVVSMHGLPCPFSGVHVKLTGESQEFACSCGAMFPVTGLEGLTLQVHLAPLWWWYKSYPGLIRP